MRRSLLVAAAASLPGFLSGCGVDRPHLTSVTVEDVMLAHTEIDGAPAFEGSFRLVIEAAAENDDDALAVVIEPVLLGIDATGQQLAPSYHLISVADRTTPLPIAPGARGSVRVSFRATEGPPFGGWAQACTTEGTLVSLHLFGDVVDEAGTELHYDIKTSPGTAAPPPPSGFVSRFGFLSDTAGDQWLDTLAVDDAGDLLWTSWSAQPGSPGWPNSGGNVLQKATTDGAELAVVPLPTSPAPATHQPQPARVVSGGGSTYVAGSFLDTADLGGPVTSAGESDVFVARLAPDASFAWVRTFGDATAQIIDAAAADSSGAIVFAGFEFTGNTDFGVPAIGSGTEFVTKLDASGAPAWSRRIGDAWVTRMAATAAGGVVLGGRIDESFDFGGGPIAAGSMFVLTLDAQGAHVSSQAIPDAFDELVSLVPLPDGGLLVGTSLSLTALNPSGALRWKRELMTGSFFLVDVAASEDGGILTILDGNGAALDLAGGETLEATGAPTRILVSLDDNGAPLRAGVFQCADMQVGTRSRLAWRPSPEGGDFVIASSLRGVAMPGDTPLTGQGGLDVLLAGIAP